MKALSLSEIIPRFGLTSVGRIFQDSSIVLVTNALAMMIGFSYSVVTAAKFGAGKEMDAFGMAQAIPNYAINLITSGYAPAIIPAFIIALKNDGQSSAQRLISNLILLSLGAMGIVCMALMLLGKPLLKIMSVGFDTRTFDLTTDLYYILVPSMMLASLSVQWSAVLNARNSFATPGIARAFYSLTGLLCVALFANTLGAFVLPLAVLFGAALQAIILGMGLRGKNIGLMISWSGFDERTIQTLKQYSSVFLGSAVIGTVTVIDQAMASSLGPGSVAALNYGNSLGFAFQSILCMALGTALLPHFAKLFNDEKIAELKKTLWFYALGLPALTVPVCALLYLFSEPMVQLIFQRGAFTATNAGSVSEVQQMALLQIPFYLIGTIGVRFFSATLQNGLLLKVGILNAGIKIFLNFMLISHLGLPALPLSSSIAVMFSSLVVLYLINRWIKDRLKTGVQSMPC